MSFGGSTRSTAALTLSVFALLSVTLYAGLIYALWTRNSYLEERLQIIEAHELLQDSSSKPVVNVLKRMTKRQADGSTQSATDLLADALNELIEKKLYTILECSADNVTDCILKPGPKGDKGETGDQGKDGRQGSPGNPGVKGDKGHYGFPGHKGEVGPRGPVGDPGAPGNRGVKGDMGDIGPIGRPGIKGEQGERGIKGQHGNPGYKGDLGVKGERGEKGEKGTKGMIGESGPQAPPTKISTEPPNITPATIPTESTTTKTNTTPTPTEPPATTPTTEPPTVLPSATCGGAGWRRVAFLDMTNTTHNCPNGLQLTGYSKRSCGRVYTSAQTCSSSIFFPVGGRQYSQVCGRAKAYQWGQTHSFLGYNRDKRTLNEQYVDGLSFTHGRTSRTHIWTFAAAINQVASNYRSDNHCPCSGGINPPPFVGNDYFCESGQNSARATRLQLYPDDPLWDGRGCIPGNPCCQHNNPPWFHKTLPTPTIDDIEMRMCAVNGKGVADIALELYVY